MKKVLEELIGQGYDNPEELLRNLEIGLQQAKEGKGYTTEELKEKLKKINEKYKKMLTNIEKDDIIPTDSNN